MMDFALASGCCPLRRCRFLAAGDALDLSRPLFKRVAFLGVELMSLIDTDDPGAGSTDVPEDTLDHLQPDPETLQVCCNGAPKIVQAPGRQRAAVRFRRCGINRPLCLRPSAQATAVRAEHILAYAPQALDQGECGR